MTSWCFTISLAASSRASLSLRSAATWRLKAPLLGAGLAWAVGTRCRVGAPAGASEAYCVGGGGATTAGRAGLTAATGSPAGGATVATEPDHAPSLELAFLRWPFEAADGAESIDPPSRSSPQGEARPRAGAGDPEAGAPAVGAADEGVKRLVSMASTVPCGAVACGARGSAGVAGAVAGPCDDGTDAPPDAGAETVCAVQVDPVPAGREPGAAPTTVGVAAGAPEPALKMLGASGTVGVAVPEGFETTAGRRVRCGPGCTVPMIPVSPRAPNGEALGVPDAAEEFPSSGARAASTMVSKAVGAAGAAGRAAPRAVAGAAAADGAATEGAVVP